MNSYLKILQAVRLAGLLVCLAALTSNSAFAFVFKVGKVSYSAEVPDGINWKFVDGFGTFTEAANYMCIQWGKPRGVYPPYAAQVEAEQAADPWGGQNWRWKRFDVTCISNTGGTVFANSNRVTSFKVQCDKPWLYTGNNPYIGATECQLTCSEGIFQLTSSGTRTTALFAAACGDAGGVTVFGMMTAQGIAPPKHPGCESCDRFRGNPADPATGMKAQVEPIYAAASAVFPLRLSLQYRSKRVDDTFDAWLGAFGMGWSSPFERRIKFYNPGTGPGLAGGSYGVTRPDGRELEFRPPASGKVFPATADIADRLERRVAADGITLTGWQYTSADGDLVELYDAKGLLLSISERSGMSYRFTYASGTSNDTAVSRYPADAPACTRVHPTAFTGWLVGAKRLLCVTDTVGRQLDFEYDAVLPRVVKMYDPAGQAYGFEYDAARNLTRISFPDTTAKVYHYNEPANINGGAACTGQAGGLPNQLTGITDENGDRFADYEYDCTGRATNTRHAGGAGKITFQYNADGTTTVSDYLGDPAAPTITPRRYSFQKTLAVARKTGIVDPATGQPKPCAGCGAVAATTYDANGNVASRTDWNGNRTNYSYDLARNLEAARSEGLASSGATTPQTRTISTEWHASFRLPARIAEPLRITTYAYDPDGSICGARGALCSKSIQATTDVDGTQGFTAAPAGTPRTWTYTYNANGSVLTVDGPRTDIADVTTYAYYANDDADAAKRGNVATISNAAGQVTSITAYNPHGQPLTIVDANGMTTTLTYDARLRLKSRDAGGEVTGYDYDNAGQLAKVTLPDGSYLAYTYDGAHRLTGISDSLGNNIVYTLDAMGNRTHEEVRDPANTLAQTRSRVYNDLNRLFRELGAENQTTEYAYDDQGNVLSVKDPLEHLTANQYDALNRLKEVTDPALGLTQYGYNGLDALTQVTDPRNLVTGYTVDGLGNLTLQSSPDTGNTTSTYDAAGNLLTQTDAKGQLTTYTYDALNRVTLITFHDGSKQAYAYDQGTNGIGRLSSITETNAAAQVTSQIAYAYDLHGRVTSDTRVVAGVQYATAYAYDGFGRLVGVTYPGGRTLTYTLDALGRVGQIDIAKDNQSQTVVSGVAYQPFGGVKSFTFGNGQVYTRTYDQDGRISAYGTGPQWSFQIGYDPASRIESIVDLGTPQYSNSYSYDSLDRLTGVLGASSDFGYAYDAVGNRTSKRAGTQTDTYAYSATSNRLSSITPAAAPVRSFVFDANGSTTADGNNTYAYDVRGRMVNAVGPVGTADFQVNALGQRVRKSSSLGETIFHYDTRGHLIAETDPAGALKREIFYLGDIPVGVVQ